MAEIQPIPDRATFMARVTGRFRSLGRKTIEVVKTAAIRTTRVAKKAGKWAFALAPVQWVWNQALKPAYQFTAKYVAKPVLVGVGSTLTVIYGTKLLMALTGLGTLGALLLLWWIIRRVRANREAAAFAEVTDNVTPIAPKKVTKTTTTVTETVEGDEVVEETEEVVETETVEVEAPVVTEVEHAEPVKGNGYKVRLADDEPKLDETLEQRFTYLDGLINAELNKPEADQDPEYICELQGRQNLIHVRAGKHSGVKKDASVADIHRDFRKSLEERWKEEHGDERITPQNSGIYGTALNRGAMAENGRLTKLVRAREAANKPRGRKAA